MQTIVESGKVLIQNKDFVRGVVVGVLAAVVATRNKKVHNGIDGAIAWTKSATGIEGMLEKARTEKVINATRQENVTIENRVLKAKEKIANIVLQGGLGADAIKNLDEVDLDTATAVK